MDVVVDLMVGVIVTNYIHVMLLFNVKLLLHLQDVCKGATDFQLLLIVELRLVALMMPQIKLRFLDFVMTIRLLVRIARILVLRMLLLVLLLLRARIAVIMVPMSLSPEAPSALRQRSPPTSQAQFHLARRRRPCPRRRRRRHPPLPAPPLHHRP